MIAAFRADNVQELRSIEAQPVERRGRRTHGDVRVLGIHPKVRCRVVRARSALVLIEELTHSFEGRSGHGSEQG